MQSSYFGNKSKIAGNLLAIGVLSAAAAPITAICSALFANVCPTKVRDWFDRKNVPENAFCSLIRASCFPLVLGGTLRLTSKANFEDKFLGAYALTSGLGIFYLDFLSRCIRMQKAVLTPTSEVWRYMLKEDGATYILGGLLCSALAIYKSLK
jgi:hypothetical protein